MARKKKHEEHENLERWLVSYADFITLLFAFFVVMYSLSSVNEGKFRVLSEALIAAFRAQPKAIDPIQIGDIAKSVSVKQPLQGTPAPSQQPSAPMPIQPIQTPIKMGIDRGEGGAAKQAEATIRQMAEAIEQELKQLIAEDLVTVRRTRLWMEVEIKTSILFPSGSARLSESALPVLEKIAEVLKRHPNPIHVEGFTDNVPISTAAFPSNWELSAARAASVVHLFMRSGIAPERMAAVGFGEHRPVGDNATAEGRNANRRVVLVVLGDPNARRPLELPPDPPADPAPEAAAVPAPETGP